MPCKCTTSADIRRGLVEKRSGSRLLGHPSTPPNLSQHESLSADGTIDTFPPLADQSIVITGPTASGKSELAIELAMQIGGEIISLDSIAVYRGMDIGTAKPTADDQSRVAHHLIDVVDPTEDFSVACYLTRAHEIVRADP